MEAGKKAAEEIINLQVQIINFLCKNANSAYVVDKIADALEVNNKREEVYQICKHLSSNPSSGVVINEANSIDLATFSAK